MFGRASKKTNNGDIPTRRRTAAGGGNNERTSGSDLSERYAFRRNRTLTGSSSAQVASSNELNAELRSPRAHAHHLTRLRRHLFAYFLAAVVAVFGLYTLLAQLVATETIQVRDVSLLTAEDEHAYRESVEQYFTSRPAERLRFLLKQNDLLGHIQASRPEVKSVSIEQGGRLGEAVVMVTARQPVARWSIDGDNKYVDGQGVVFGRSYYGDPGLQIVDNSGATAGAGQLVASNRFLGFIGRVLSGSEINGLSVKAVTIPAGTTRQIIVTLKGSSIQYKLSVDRSAGQQVEDMARVNKYLADRGVVPGYVDLRIAGKAYYK